MQARPAAPVPCVQAAPPHGPLQQPTAEATHLAVLLDRPYTCPSLPPTPYHDAKPTRLVHRCRVCGRHSGVHTWRGRRGLRQCVCHVLLFPGVHLPEEGGCEGGGDRKERGNALVGLVGYTCVQLHNHPHNHTIHTTNPSMQPCTQPYQVCGFLTYIQCEKVTIVAKALENITCHCHICV